MVSLQRGFDLAKEARIPGPFRILSAGKSGETHNEAKAKGPGFAIGRATNLGKPQWSDEDFWPLNTTLFATDFHGNDPRWLFYWFENADLTGFDSGSVQPMLNRNYIASISINLPPIEEQTAIATMLRSLDDKIAANQTSISKIDEILRALWQKELSLSNIDVPLSSLASFINGKAFTKGASGTGRVVVRIAEMNSGIGSRTVYSDIDAAPDNVVDPGELLFSWSGTLMTKRWPYNQAIVNQHIFKVVPNGQLDLWALRQAIDAQLEYFQMIAAGKATTMGHIKRGDLDQEVEVPAQMSEETNQLGNSLWGLATSLEIQNLQLARTRDELLPLLMSGRITVGEAEDAADEAASES
ncbi:restriction endonuclease subunit S [Corynebacterium phoceense]|uniref:restriction endonuclease subunit S n=1 Tax=Corynebacterium phoceense TaxID=1686286 RepID=UPI00211C2D5B|nr:restriction endonuclease subunit S [Corynebacterium phoceense]